MSWHYMACDPCGVKWRGASIPCWVCENAGIRVPPAAMPGAMQWDDSLEAQ